MTLVEAGDQARTAGRVPAVIRDLEISEPLPGVPAVDGRGRRVGRAWLLVRAFTEPLGFVVRDVPETGLRPCDLGAAVLAELGPAVRERVEAAGGTLGDELPEGGVTVPGEPAYLARRAEVLRDAPRITVAICTRERPEMLRRCLSSLAAQRYPMFRILIVDNAPRTDATARVAREAALGPIPVEYVVEPRPGTSFARNTALRAAAGEIVAWLDDDTEADPHWLAEIARALAEHPEADLVSGLIVPAEFETPAQLLFEEFGGLSKGRGCTPYVFSPLARPRQSPLYPLPPFGSGANLVFRPGVGERIGGFDTALGGGTPAAGGEDTLVFMTVLHRGGTVVYRPGVMIRHYHRRDLDGLARQLVGYGSGLTAAYTALVLRNPLTIFPLLRLAPRALHDLRSSDGPRLATVGEDFPEEILRANRRGMIAGPTAYLRGRARSRRVDRTAGGR